MDWIGIVIFILFIVFKAMGESNKQKRQKEARPQGTPTPGRTIPKPIQKSSPPVTMPDWGFPSMFPFFEEEEVVQPVKPAKSPEPVKRVVSGEPVRESRPLAASQKHQGPQKQSSEEFAQEAWSNFGLKQAQLGIIYSEILSPPRALRPYRPRSYRG